MLMTLNNNEWVTPQQIEAKYPHCKYLFTDFSDVNELKGHLYAVSDDRDSFIPLCRLSDELSEKGVVCCVMGEYQGEGMIGVLRESAG